ncbi:MAG: acyl-CoA dehydrogenase family protein, partial [Pseudomonadota bacterium]
MTRLEDHPTLVAARRLAPELSAQADHMEQARRLPADLAKNIAQEGLFRLVTPAAYGGFECSPRQILDVLEELGKANASAAWCVMIGATTAMNAAYLAPEHAQDI